MAELPTNQLRLVDVRLHFRDKSFVATHVFPFVDARWKVAFVLFELYLAGLRVLRGGVEVRADGLHARGSSEDLERLGAVPLAELASLVHFDPWWVFKTQPYVAVERIADLGVASPAPAWIEAVKAANIAVHFRHGGRRYAMEDADFDPGLRRLEAIRARDSLSRPRVFRYGDIDLPGLRRLAPSA